MPIITAASDDMDNSVMIASVRNFQSRTRRGAVMRMNSEGVRFVSYKTIHSECCYSNMCACRCADNQWLIT